MDYENGQIEPESSPPKVYKLPPEELDTEFKKEFPPDPVIGSEMNDAARVWKVYRREAMAFDSTLLDGWSSTLDILLIFAGLFSAVATAFVIESYQLLQPDNAAYTAAALYILVAASNNTTGLNLPPPPDLAFASPLTRWINGLWFTSILLSLTVALLSILVKQWISEYRARNNASAQSARHWAHRHWLFAQALRAWPVAELVSFLPVLLHLSLFLFFAGVIAFLWNMDRAIGVWIVVLGFSLAIFYVACTLIPVWIPECPTSTPLVAQMRKFLVPAALILLRAFLASCALGLRVRRRMRNCWERLDRRATRANRLRRTDDSTLATTTPHPVSEHSTLSTQFQRMARRLEALRRDKPVIHRQLDQQQSDDLDKSTLCWLIEDVPDSDAVAVALQALGAIHPASALADQLRNHGNIVNFTDEAAYTKSAAAASASEALRVMRSTLCMYRTVDSQSRTWGGILDSNYADMYLLCRRWDYKYDRRYDHPYNLESYDYGLRLLSQTSDSLTSTAMLLLPFETSLPGKLACLASCDWHLLSPDVDGNFILDLLYSEANVKLLDRPSRSSNLEPMHEIADLFAHMALQYPSNWVQHVTAQLVPRLLSCVVDRATPQTLSLQPFILEFLTSDVFSYELYFLSTMDRIAEYLGSGARNAMLKGTRISIFWQAVAVIAHRAWYARNDVDDIRCILKACDRGLAYSQSEPALSDTLAGFFGSSSQVATGIPSIWTLLQPLWFYRLQELSFLSERLGGGALHPCSTRW